MLSKRLFLLQLIAVLTISGEPESVELCSENETTNSKSVFLITFGSGSDTYSKSTPADFHFNTPYRQIFTTEWSSGAFCIVNVISGQYREWHDGALDHTANDVDGYMYLIDLPNSGPFFNLMVNNICIELRYEFSVYFANIVSKNDTNDWVKPNIGIEVRTATIGNQLLEKFITGNIPEYDDMTWWRYGLSFIASGSSIVLSLISNVEGIMGNDLAIDDIELRVCSLVHPSSSLPNCSSPLITFIPNAPFLSKPAKFRRNQDIYITTKLHFNSIEQSRSIIYQWTIFNCLSTCSNQVALPDTTQKELFIQSRTLPTGIYECKLTVTTIDTSSTLSSSSSIYVEIANSNINTNLVSIAKLTIKHNFKQVLILNPGQYWYDPDRLIFDPQKWNYTYYCRIYHLNNSMINEEFKLFEDSNQNCFSNPLDINYIWESMYSSKSSVKILSQSMKPNQTYQFMVEMIYYENTLLQSIAYLFVEVENIDSPIITISCLISKLCSSNREFAYINPNVQLALVSFCSDNCLPIVNVAWNIYQGSRTSPSSAIQWIPFNQMLFGLNAHNLTILKDIFLENSNIIYWRFQVIYTFESEMSNNTIDIEINQPPENGYCKIDPPQGTINTLFNITCSNWNDTDGIKDYLFYGLSKDSSKRLMLGSTNKANYQLRLPASSDAASSLHISVQIRDTFDAMTEFNLSSSVTILTNSSIIFDLIDNLQNSNNDSIFSSLIATADQNGIGQLISSISHVMNELNDQNLKSMVENGIPSTSISVTSLNNEKISNISKNDFNFDEYEEQLNKHANAREQLMYYFTNLSIISENDLKFQSSILTELTQTTNLLTRKTSTLATKKCQQLSEILKSSVMKMSNEDVQSLSTDILQSAANIMTSINGPLQGRTKLLRSDSNRIHHEIINNSDIDDDEHQINMCYQKQTANEIFAIISEIISSITSSLSIHLDLNRSVIIDTNSIYFSLEKLSSKSLSNRTINQIHLPIDLNINNSIVLLRSIIEPLSFVDDFQIPSVRNLSRSVSLSILNETGESIEIKTTFDDPFQLIIPRDPNFIIPDMYLQNVTNKSLLFNFHIINLQINYSIHLEIRSLNNKISYLLIYQFDSPPQLSNVMKNIDGWNLLCETNEDEGIYTRFMDNNQTANHRLMYLGIRELSENEKERFCGNQSSIPPMIVEKVKFSANYEIRSYLSACFYLNKDNQWKSDGLLVGPLTNHYQTECLSIHLTTFTSTVIFLPSPISYSMKNNSIDIISKTDAFCLQTRLRENELNC